jgi:hypothetical protein
MCLLKTYPHERDIVVLTLPVSRSTTPSNESGTIWIRIGGGSGMPRSVVVWKPTSGMVTPAASKCTRHRPSSSFTALPLPPPPSALYTKSGYRDTPSPHPLVVRNSTVHSLHSTHICKSIKQNGVANSTIQCAQTL